MATLTHDQMLDRSYISPRQLYYWTNKGYLRLDPRSPVGRAGRGYTQLWADGEDMVALVMGGLSGMGLNLSVCEDVARQVATNPDHEKATVLCPIGPGVWLEIAFGLFKQSLREKAIRDAASIA